MLSAEKPLDPATDKSRRSDFRLDAKGRSFADSSSSMWLVVTLGTYASMILFMKPLSFGDTIFYVKDILAAGPHPQLSDLRTMFDFGHLLWRPLGWALSHAIQALAPSSLRGEERITVLKTLIGISVISGAIATIVLHLICQRLGFRRAVSSVVCATFVCSNAVVYAATTGLSYMLGLTFLMVAFWLAIRSEPRHAQGVYRTIWLAGMLLALSATSWFPFVLVVPAVAAAALVRWDDPQILPTRDLLFSRAVHLMGATVVTGVAILGAAALVLHIHNIAEIKAWVTASAHGWRQSQNFLRLGMGLPRCCVALTDDAGVVWKRFLFHDPLAPVKPQDLLRSSLMLMVAFYFGLFFLIHTLTQSSKGRVFLWLLMIAAVPVLVFAVFLFEPSSIERYIPAFPFYFVALGYQLQSNWPNQKQRSLALIYPGVLILFSITTYNNWKVTGHWEPARARLQELREQLPPGSTVALLGNWDEVFLFVKDNPLNDRFSQSLNLWVVLQPAHERVFIWRELLAERGLTTWGTSEMWLSERLLAETPLPEWGWVEGDDRAIYWSQVPKFCRRLQYDKKLGNTDGFVRLARTQTNRELLESAAAGHLPGSVE
jgi:hypothetical protein